MGSLMIGLSLLKIRITKPKSIRDNLTYFLTAYVYLVVFAYETDVFVRTMDIQHKSIITQNVMYSMLQCTTYTC